MISKDTQLGFEDGRIEDVTIAVHSELHVFKDTQCQYVRAPRAPQNCRI
jgi:hypothetical protein